MNLEKMIPISIALEETLRKNYLENKSFRDILEGYKTINQLDSSKESIPAVVTQSVIFIYFALY